MTKSFLLTAENDLRRNPRWRRLIASLDYVEFLIQTIFFRHIIGTARNILLRPITRRRRRDFAHDPFLRHDKVYQSSGHLTFVVYKMAESSTDERFASYTSEELQNLLENRDSTNTKQCIEAAKRILYQYCDAKELNFDKTVRKPKEELAQFMINFFAEIRKQNGEMYSRSSMISIRFGLQRYFQSVGKFDIVNDTDFRLSNEMFKAVLTNIKRSGKGSVQHKEIISEADMTKLFSSNVLDTNDPQGLQYKVFIDVMFYTCRRGRENLRKMKVKDFVLKVDGQGRRYIQNIAQYETKNHRGSDIGDEDAASARIYEIPGDTRCPVSSIEKYLLKLNPNCEFFWQRPKRHAQASDAVWFDNSPVGHNTLGNFMKTISVKAELSTLYTNHCIRATCITSLDQSGIEARHIMSVSGHKSETSIKSYSRCVSETKKHEMCSVLQSVVNPQLATNTCNTANTAVILPTSTRTSSDALDVFNCDLEAVDTETFLCDILDHDGKQKPEAEQSKENIPVSSSSEKAPCGPQFHSVGHVHIHYHMK